MSGLRINSKTIGKDIIAGLTAAIAGIPDGMASATLAGVNPVYGPAGAFEQKPTPTRVIVVPKS